MKKLLVILMTGLMMLVLGGCGSDGGSSASAEKVTPAPASTSSSKSASAPSSGKAAAKDSKTLVVYFSATGNTKALAGEAAKALDAELVEIQPEQPYTQQDLNYNDETTRATVEMKDESARPAIKNKVEDMAKYDTVVIAYPIWWGQAPRIIDTFMESYDFAGKTIIPICTSGGSDIGTSADYLHKFAPKANWKDGQRFDRGTTASALKDWFTSQGVGK